MAGLTCALFTLLIAPSQTTTPGPETEGLAATVKGSMVFTKPLAGIELVELPSKDVKVVRAAAHDGANDVPRIHAVSGPNEDGTIAYVEDYIVPERKHLLKTIQCNGTRDTEIFSRPGSAGWAKTAAGKGEIGTHISMSPRGHQIAFISRITNKQMPNAQVAQGQIEIRDIERKTGYATSDTAVDKRMAWFPSGDKLAFTKFVAREKLKDAPGVNHFDDYRGNHWDQLPAIFILDISTGESSLLCAGWTPVVSDDGNTVAVSGWGGDGYKTCLVDVETKSVRHVKLPGQADCALAITRDGKVVYPGLPTEGAPVIVSPFGSPIARRTQLITIKVANIWDGTFETVLTDVDPRRGISFSHVYGE